MKTLPPCDHNECPLTRCARTEAAEADSVQRMVGTPGEYCETVEEALADGWLKPYEGGRAADGWKGRIYGRRPGNHRIFRCTKRPNNRINDQ